VALDAENCHPHELCLGPALELINRAHSGMTISPGILLWNLGTTVVVYPIVSYLVLELRSSQRCLSILTSTDLLTGIWNRRAFLESLDSEIARHHCSEQPLLLAYLDLDNFKQINDTLGHRKGVEVLKAVTSGSVQSLRRTDIVGRLGGDEFAVPMPETEGEETVAVLSAVRCKTSRHQLKRVYR
jgi:diguanylate cyclase (GGDEF)-like protein